MKIATWNINSVRLRLPLLKKIAEQEKPDVICLQETKVEDALFPADAIRAMGYKHVHFHGMKSYNGVAILSRHAMDETGIHHRAGKQDCRHISAVINGIDVHCLYVPAGGDIPDRTVNDKFGHKLDLVSDVTKWFPKQYKKNAPVVVAGDFNIAPLEHDVWSHKQLLDVVSHTPVEVERLTAFQKSMDWVDAIRHFVPAEQKCYTWWSYRNRDWKKSNRGRRLDHIWVTAPLSPRLKKHGILADARAWPQPSDHVPVFITLSK